MTFSINYETTYTGKTREQLMAQTRSIFKILLRRYAPEGISWKKAKSFIYRELQYPYYRHAYQYVDFCTRVVQYWKCKKELVEMGLPDEFPLLPEDLLQDLYSIGSVIDEAKKKKLFDECIPNLAKQYSSLEMELDGYTFLVPKNIEEIKAESSFMRNCLFSRTMNGEYTDGRWYIVLVRKTDAPEIPFADLLITKKDYTHSEFDPAFLVYKDHEYIDPRDEFSAALEKWYEKVAGRKLEWREYQQNRRHI